jgi:hypothetical protein
MPYSAADVRARPRILRMLLCGPAKSGKTVSAVRTCPKPVFVFNTDGKGALDPVVSLGGEFTADDVTSVGSFNTAFSYLRSHLNDFETVVFDNITGFSDMVLGEVRAEVGRDDPRVIYPEYSRRLMACMGELLKLPRHLIIIGHLEPGEKDTPGGFGHVLGVAGTAKTKISMIMQDWVWMHTSMGPVGEDGRPTVLREFLLAPEGNWTKAVRSIQGTTRMKADVSRFIDLMEKGGPKAALAATSAKKPAGAAVAAPAARPVPANGQPVRR